MDEVVFYEDKDIKIGNQLIKYKSDTYMTDKMGVVNFTEISISYTGAAFFFLFGLFLCVPGHGLLTAIGIFFIVLGIISIIQLLQNKKVLKYKIRVHFIGSKTIEIESEDLEYMQKLKNAFSEAVAYKNKTSEKKDNEVFDSRYKSLEKIKILHENGILNEEEFNEEKRRILLLSNN